YHRAEHPPIHSPAQFCCHWFDHPITPMFQLPLRLVPLPHRPASFLNPHFLQVYLHGGHVPAVTGYPKGLPAIACRSDQVNQLRRVIPNPLPIAVLLPCICRHGTALKDVWPFVCPLVIT